MEPRYDTGALTDGTINEFCLLSAAAPLFWLILLLDAYLIDCCDLDCSLMAAASLDRCWLCYGLAACSPGTCSEWKLAVLNDFMRASFFFSMP